MRCYGKVDRFGHVVTDPVTHELRRLGRRVGPADHELEADAATFDLDGVHAFGDLLGQFSEEGERLSLAREPDAVVDLGGHGLPLLVAGHAAAVNSLGKGRVRFLSVTNTM